MAAAKSTVSKTKDTTMAIVAYIVFFIPLLTESKNDPFVKFHVKQGMLLWIVAVGWSIVSQIFLLVPVLGWLAGGLIGMVVAIFLLVLWIMGIMNAANGKEVELPIIGKYAQQLKF